MPVKNRAERTLIAVKILHQMADYAEYTARELAQIIGENVHIISGAMRYLKARNAIRSIWPPQLREPLRWRRTHITPPHMKKLGVS